MSGARRGIRTRGKLRVMHGVLDSRGRHDSSNGEAVIRPQRSRRLSLLILLVVAMTIFAGTSVRAEQPEGKTLNAKPATCEGWANAAEARTVDLPRSAPAREFSAKNSAAFAFVPGRPGVFGESAVAPTLHCQDFNVAKVPSGPVVSAAVIISLAATADAASTDVLVPSFSIDGGRNWSMQSAILLQGTNDNAQHDGYWRFPLPNGLTADDLRQFAFRLEYRGGETFAPVTIFVDGLALEVTVPREPSVLRRLFKVSDQPVIIVDETSLESVELLDADGQPIDAPLEREIVDGKTRLTIRQGRALKPGAYILRTKSRGLFRPTIEEQPFSFGVASLNTPQAVYEPGDLVTLAASTLDDRGRTVCDAALSLRISKPDGSMVLLSTGDRSVIVSAECGPDSLTNRPDYSGSLLADQQGTYRATLEVQTDQGVERVEQTFEAQPVAPFRMERLAPTRINPKASYRARLRVTPQRDFQGIVEERVPASFIIKDSEPAAAARTEGDEQILRWTVEAQAGETLEVSYVFDAPDVSPALYILGPLSVGDQREPRRWTISSDEVVRRERPGVAYESLAVEAADWVANRDALVTPTKTVFRGEENVHLKAFKRGYRFDAEDRPAGLDSDRPLEVTKVDVTGPDGAAVRAVHVSESFRQGERSLEMLHLVPERTFRPGVYTVTATITDGTTTVTDETTFAWGVLVIDTPKSVSLPGETVSIGMSALDASGKTVCDADLTLTVSAPTGPPTVLTTDGGGIERSATCGPITVTNVPDYQTTLLAETAGDYAVTLTATIKGQSYTITDTLAVRPSVPFVVERQAPTRVFPPAEYDLGFTVTPSADYQGTFEEFIPSTYAVVAMGQGGVSEASGPDATVLRWAVDWQAGELYSLTYRVDPEDISPAIFRLGPAKVGDFTEFRHWQIASDAVGSAISARLWSAGFELQTTTAEVEYTANVGVPSINTTTVRSGAAAFRTNPSATAIGMSYDFKAADTADNYFFRAYVRVATAPSDETQILLVRDSAATDQMSIRMNTDRTLELWDEEDALQVGSASSALALNTWYRVELRYDTATQVAGSMIADARLDGTSFASSTTLDHLNGPMTFRVGVLTSTAADLYFDDLAINDDSTSADNWAGEGKIVHLQPDGDGTNESWDNSSGTDCASDGSGCWTYLDEVTPNDGTDYIQCAANTDSQDVTLESSTSAGLSAGDEVRLVEAWVRTQSTVASLSTHALTIMDGANTDAGSNVGINVTGWFTNDNDKPRNADIVSYNAPGAGNTLPITTTMLDGMQIRLTTSDCSPVVNVSTIWGLVEYVPRPGGRLYSSGFELQSLTAGEEWETVAGTLDIDTTTYRSGAAALRVQSLVSATEESVLQSFKSANDNGPFFLRTYLRITTAPSAENRIIEYQDSGGTARVYLTLDNGRLLRLYDEDGQVGSASSALNTGTWYRIEAKIDASGAGAADTVEARVDGTNFATAANRDLTNGVTAIVLGGNLNAEAQTTGDWYFDDVGVNEGFGAVQNGYPGAGGITHLRPNATGDNSAWTNANTEIDEIDPDDGTTIITSTTLNQIEDVNLDSSTTGGIGATDTITLVSAGVRFSNSSATVTSAFRVRLKDNASAVHIEGNELRLASTTYFTHQVSAPRLSPLTVYTRPHLSSAWTTGVLDTAQIGVRLTTDGGTNTINVSTLWLLVEYTPAGITVSGTCDQYDQTTDCVDDGSNAIRVAVNGTLQAQTDATVDGAWSIASVSTPAANDVITVFIDANADANEAVAVTVYDGTSDITGVTLFQRHLTIGSDDNQTVTNANLSQYDNSVSGDEDIFFDVSAGNDLTVDSVATYTDEELYLASGDTFRPASAGGADVTTVHVELVGTWTADSNAVTAAGDFVNTGTFTANTSTVTMSGTGNLNAGGATFNNLTVNGSGNTVTVTGSDATVSGTITLGGAADANNDTLTLASGRTLTLSGNTGTTLDITASGTDTVNGPGRLTYRNSATTFPTAGTLAATLIVRFDTLNGNMTIPARTDYGVVEAFGDSANARTLTLASGTLTTSSHFQVLANAASPNDVTIAGATNNPTVNVGGDLDFTGSGTAAEVITSGTGTWTVTGNTDFTGGTYTAASGNTLLFNGTGTLTSASQTLQNLQVNSSGTVTLAAATHTVAGNLLMGGTGTPTVTGSTITLTGTSNTIDGGGKTLNNLTINPATAGTITLQNTDLTVSGTLVVETGDTLSLNASRTLTHSGATLTLNGTVSGAGQLTYQSSTAFPTAGTISSILRMDATNNDQTLSARTYGGAVEAYNNHATLARIVTLGTGASQTLTFSSNLTLNAANAQNVTLAGATNNPTVNLTGNLTYTNGGAGTEIITSGTGIWTASGNVDFSNGTYTAASGNTLVMNGSSKTLTSSAQTLQNLTFSGTITLANATHTVAAALDMTGGTITAGSSTVTMTGTANLVGGGNTLNHLTINGSGTTVTIATSDLSVSGTLTVGGAADGDNDTLSIGSGRTVTSTATGTVTLVGSGTDTISGAGILKVQNSNLGSGGTLSSLVTYDATNGDITLTARTYGGAATVTNTGASNRTVTAGSGTLAFSSTFDTSRSGAGTLTFTLETNDPTTTVTGNLTIGAGTTLQASSTAAFTVGGSWSNSGTFTAGTGTVTMDAGSGTKTIDTNDADSIAGAAFHHLTFNDGGGTATFRPVYTLDVNGNLTITGGTLDMTGPTTFYLTNDGGGTVNQRLLKPTNPAGSADNTAVCSDDAVLVSGYCLVNPRTSNTTWSTLPSTIQQRGYMFNDGMAISGSFAAGTWSAAVTTNIVEGAYTYSTRQVCGKLWKADAALTSGTIIKDWTCATVAGTGVRDTTISFGSLAAQTLSSQVVYAEFAARLTGGVENTSGATTVTFRVNEGGAKQQLTTPAFTPHLLLGGNWTNSDLFTHASGTVVLDGSSQQTVGSGATSFSGLTVTNSSGSDPETSPSVIFSSAATTAGTFTAETANTKVRFNAGSTYTFQNISLNGQATSTRVALRSSTTGTAWNLNVAGTRSVANTDVRDSNACGQAPNIDGSDGTNFDAGGNSCWDVNTLTFSVSDNAIGFGSLSSSAARWASGDDTGSSSDVAAHTLAITTNARSGYAITYNGATLTSGANTISAATITDDADGTPGSEQFAVGFQTNGNATIASGYDHNTTASLRDWNFVPSTTTTAVSETGATATETISAYYLANISSITEAGSYTTTITYIATATF